MKKARLKSGDELTFGNTRYRVVIEPDRRRRMAA